MHCQIYPAFVKSDFFNDLSLLLVVRRMSDKWLVTDKRWVPLNFLSFKIKFNSVNYTMHPTSIQEHLQFAFYNRYFVKIDDNVVINYKKIAPNPACIIDSRFTSSNLYLLFYVFLFGFFLSSLPFFFFFSFSLTLPCRSLRSLSLLCSPKFLTQSLSDSLSLTCTRTHTLIRFVYGGGFADVRLFMAMGLQLWFVYGYRFAAMGLCCTATVQGRRHVQRRVCNCTP